MAPDPKQQRAALAALRSAAYNRRWWWTVGFWVWLVSVHLAGLVLFTGGFLLTRLMLEDTSACASPPAHVPAEHHVVGSAEDGCWHPRAFRRAVVVVVDALRYDFAVPRPEGVEPRAFHDSLPFMYEAAASSPQNAFLRPFIADPPTVTMQRLKGLTTGTLPTFVDMGSSFSGTAIEEDNLLTQMRTAGRRIAHVGDDSWWALFPGHFEESISAAYDSFNVWDLHTVDNGVIENLLPLLQPDRTSEWDLLIGHCLGVDHAGHRYGPDHPAMGAKLQQVNEFIRNMTALIDEDTLLVVMGDHGMDSKGDHGGESDDEVESTLWMYSKRPFFGRTISEFATPPATAKVRPVGQIDIVPTLALLLGIPIPYNSLGRPIEEAFAGTEGNNWDQLAAVSRLSAAGIKRYQESYFAARGMSAPKELTTLWAMADAVVSDPSSAYIAWTRFQEETLGTCKELWARFDIGRMAFGVVVMALGVITLLIYVAQDPDDEALMQPDHTAFNFAQRGLEPLPSHELPYKTLHRRLLTAVAAGCVPGVSMAFAIISVTDAHWSYGAGAVALFSSAAVIVTSLSPAKAFSLLPTTIWGWLAVIFTLGQSIGFASNSYTVWEDTISMFFITTFGFAAFVASFRLPLPSDRTLAAYHSVMLMVLPRIASFSRLCRDEQMPYCVSTYYASSSSSTSAPWQLAIPFVAAVVLPSVVRSFMSTSRSYEGIAPTLVGYFFRGLLLLAGAYWVFDAADNDGWWAWLPEGSLKAASVWTARTLLALALVAGTTAFMYSAPPIDISITQNQIVVLGFANASGARYLTLPLNIAAACILVSKPMGGGALAIMLWQTLTLADLLHLLSLKTHPIGAVVLGVLGNFYFFRTGHQAVLSTIQWDSAFAPLYTMRYPWSPLLIVLNSFAGQIMAVACAPLLVLWKEGPRRKGALEHVARRAVAPLVGYFAVETLATMVFAGWLRRHLMLYRVFGPRFMMAAVVLVVVELSAVLIALGGVRANTYGVSELFGWAD